MTRIAVLAVGTLLAAATQAAPPRYTVELTRIGGIKPSVTSPWPPDRDLRRANQARVLDEAVFSVTRRKR